MRKHFHSAFGGAFSSLQIPNYRIFFTGQSISLIGTWMQMTAQSWLVLTLSHSSTDLGLVVGIQTLPILLLAPYGGVIADRIDKRRLMIVLQSAMGLQALLLGLLAVLGVVKIWEVFALAAILGCNNAFEAPSRQSFIREVVDNDALRNAVTLNSVMQNAARAIGPAIGGIVIAIAGGGTVGAGYCFLFNAASFVAVVTSLLVMHRAELHPVKPTTRDKGQLREGFRYAAHTPQIAIPLAMMALVGTLAYEFQVSLPVLARVTFHGGSEAYGFMNATVGVGAVVGGLFSAARNRTGFRAMILALALFGLAILFLAVSPTLLLAGVILLFVGWGSVSFISIASTAVQLNSAPHMRGRAVALWQVAFQGTTPIGGPIIGWIISASNPRIGIAVGGASCLIAAVGGAVLARRLRNLTNNANATNVLLEENVLPTDS